MSVSFLEALMGMHVDTSGLESGLKKAEDLAEASTKKIAGNFGLMAAGIATAIAGTVIVALEKAIKVTAEYGEQMEHLGNRMGMTAGQAATLVGVMERHGIATGVAARSMQILAMEAKQTTDAVDPFNTRLGKTLGTLRDTSGAALNMSQIFDLARQKVAAASTETQKLQIAQTLVGTRMGGQLLPVLKLTNEEWERQKKAVEDALGPVDEAAAAAMQYKEATAALDQSIRGLELELGTKLLPGLVQIVDWLTKATSATVGFLSSFGKVGTAQFLSLLEAVHLVSKGTTEAFMHMEEYQKSAAAAKAKQEEIAQELEKTEKQEAELVKLTEQRTKLLGEQQKLGMATAQERASAVAAELAELEKQRSMIKTKLEDPTLEADTRMKLENDLIQNRLAGVQAVAKAAADEYQEEELHAKALGLVNQQTEIEFLEKRLSDARIVGDERLKLEADLYEKRKKFEEESVTTAVKMGAITVDQEIAYRKQKAGELLGRGDVLGASSEIMKARDLALQQADEQMEFVKKMHTVSIQSEIEFQRQKLEVVKGNAAEEMKVIEQIADLDKKQYDQRLQFNLNYTQSIVGEYQKIMDAAKKSGETQTFEQAKVDSERKLVESTREARGVLQGGGTEAQRTAAVEFAQFVNKNVEQMQQLGEHVSGIWQEAADAAKDILKAASGGEEVRSPGGPSPEVGSILSPMEGLATQGLARGSDIPRLDTSFTDLATRLRDVLNTNVSNLVNFGSAVGDAAKKISAITGVPLNPGATGPGGNIISPGSTQQSPQLGGGTATVAPPTLGPGGVATTPTPQTGVGPSSGNDAIISAIKSLGDKMDGVGSSVSDAQRNSASQIAEAIAAIQASRSQVGVTVSVDPNSGDILTTQKLLEQL